MDYELTVQGDTAAGQARLTIDVFKEGWVSLPIPPGLRVRDGRLDGRPVTIATQPDASGRPSAAILLSRTGRAVIALDVSVPIAARAGSETIVLPASPSPVQRATLTLRSPDLALTVNGGVVAERTPTADAVRFEKWFHGAVKTRPVGRLGHGQRSGEPEAENGQKAARMLVFGAVQSY